MALGDGLDAETREPSAQKASSSSSRVPALTIIHHPVMERAGERALVSEDGSYELSRLAPGFGRAGRPLEDGFISRSAVRLVLERDAIRFEQPSRPTALAIDGVEVEGSLRLPRAALERGVVIELGRRAVLLLHLAPVDVDEDDLGIIGQSAAMQRVRRDVRTFAPLMVPVLLRGATGAGKEVAARAIHAAGPRAAKPYVAVNLAALSASVAASELFGHKKGAFTGAIDDHSGFFQRANGGTLFLDEIGEAPVDVQVMLLRALETATVQPVGGREVPVDVRVISATDADLEAATKKGAFRPALLHRLRGYEIELPPLCDRREDLGLLLVHFVKKEAAELGIELAGAEDTWLPAEVASRLARHSWPGNVRELRNVARQIAVMIGHGEKSFDRLKLASDEEPDAEPEVVDAPVRKPAAVGDEEIIEALERADWRIARAATALGISRTSLYRRIEKHPELEKSKNISREEIQRAVDAHAGDHERAARSLKISKAALRLRLAEK